MDIAEGEAGATEDSGVEGSAGAVEDLAVLVAGARVAAAPVEAGRLLRTKRLIRNRDPVGRCRQSGSKGSSDFVRHSTCSAQDDNFVVSAGRMSGGARKDNS